MSAFGMNWRHTEEKDNLSNLINESSNKNGTTNFQCHTGARGQKC
jgi:hypothetical protein